MNFALGAMPPIPAPVSAPSATTAASTSKAAATHQKLMDAAQQFEGMLLQELLKPMREHGFDQDDADGSDGSSDTLSSFGTEAVANAIAKGGGLGIARKVVEQVEGEAAAHRALADGSNAPLIRNSRIK